MADKNSKFPEPYNPDGLSEDEAREKVVAASNASKRDFDPATADAGDKVVELANRASYRVKDLVDHPDPNIAGDAQAAVEERNPGQQHYPNGKPQAKASEDNTAQSTGSSSTPPQNASTQQNK